MTRKSRDSVWQGVDTRRANAARREMAARTTRETQAPASPQPQKLGCSLGCHGLNHRASCPNVVACPGCGGIEWNRYEPRCLGCGMAHS